MKSFILFLSLFSSLSFGGVKYVDVALNNLGENYNTSYPQLTMTGAYWPQRLGITNATNLTICCNISTSSTVIPPATPVGDEYCVPGMAIKMYDGAAANGNVYCRSREGANSSGFYIVETWGNK